MTNPNDRHLSRGGYYGDDDLPEEQDDIAETDDGPDTDRERDEHMDQEWERENDR